MVRSLIQVTAATLVLSTIGPPTCQAGVSPENVIVVVNKDSYESRTLANEYIDARNIPSANVILLDQVPKSLKVDVEVFKQRVLRPVLEQINQRRIAQQVKVIAYSTGFPTALGIKAHKAKLPKHPNLKLITPWASINGLTYFYAFVLADNPQYLGFESNLYCREQFARNFENPFYDTDNRLSFKAATFAFDKGEFKQAAQGFEQLFESSPLVAPLAVRAAEAYVKSGDTATAKTMMMKAIKAGWTSSTWLAENETLAPLLESPPLSSFADRLSDAPIEMQEPVGFSAQAVWSASGHRLTQTDGGAKYLMSCMLGVVHPRGSQLQQAAELLRRAANSDRTYPDAWFWFTVSEDVRSRTRILGTTAARAWLNHLGRNNAPTLGDVPNESGKCVGLMLGTPKTQLENRNWEFVPGALSDNLTSQGGNFPSRSQSKLTELLNAGAAMSSGTVHEPYALQPKFPLPIMYGYYASGATAIEAYYLSVASPYQLLIVGDPLAQPYARPPLDQFAVRLPSGDNEPNLLHIERSAETAKASPRAGAYELYVNGRLARRIESFETVNLRLPPEINGAIEIRLVTVANTPLQSSLSHTHWVELDAGHPIPEARLGGVPGSIQVQAPGADTVEFEHHGETVGSVAGSQGEFTLDPAELGGGAVRMRPVAVYGDQRVPGRPVVVDLPIKQADMGTSDQPGERESG